MNILEIMERTGARDFGVVKTLVNDALQEIQRIIPGRTTYTLVDVVAGTRFYTLPATMELLVDVKRKYDTQGRYISIPRVVNVNLDEPATVAESTAISSTDIVVV